MPIYEYEHVEGQPENCLPRVEVFQSMSERPLTVCPKCGAAVKRVISLFSGHVDKMGSASLKEKGFTKLVKRDKGVYEKE